MKKTINVSLASRDYTIDDDAYQALSLYLDTYRQCIKMGYQSDEVMEELEAGIADHFDQKIAGGRKVIDLETVNEVASQIGYPEGYHSSSFSYDNDNSTTRKTGPRKFFRDKEHGSIGGVCSGLAAYFNLDILLVRIVFLVLLFSASIGFWLYMILWIFAPKAITPADKCQMRGWATTPENINKFSKH